MIKKNYHSALTNDLKNQKEVEFFKIKNSIAFYYNIIDSLGLPKEYSKCDVLYSELSWKGGLKRFNERAKRIACGQLI